MKQAKEYGTAEWIFAGVFVAIYIVANIFFLTAKECPGIDKPYITCYFSLTSFFDWLGLIVFNIAPVFMIYGMLNPTYAKSEKSNPAGKVIAVTFILGMAIIGLL